jgi:hypothetical protein
MISLSAVLIRLRGLSSVILSSLILLLTGLTVAQAQVPAGSNRPSAVPEEYVITPMGYFHPSCVQELSEGDIVRRDEKAIEHKDGSFDSVHSCEFPHYSPAGEKVPLEGEGPAAEEKVASDVDDAAPPPYIAHEYIELETMKKHPTNTYYGELRANWIVPPAPTSHDGQTIFFFPGLEDYRPNVTTTILQPVLGWNATPAFKNVWSLASWNCCVNGTVMHSSFIPTSAGDTIFGVMVCTRPGSPRCSSFNVNTYDQTTGKMTELKQTSSFGLYFNWAFAGALEVYRVSQCSDYPAGSTGSTEFYYLGLYDDLLHPVTQGWVPWQRSGGFTPQCGYGLSGGFKDGLHEITLKY